MREQKKKKQKRLRSRSAESSRVESSIGTNRAVANIGIWQRLSLIRVSLSLTLPFLFPHLLLCRRDLYCRDTLVPAASLDARRLLILLITCINHPQFSRPLVTFHLAVLLLMIIPIVGKFL